MLVLRSGAKLRENKRRRSILVGKSAQTSVECNKLIMVSRVPGYGHLEYLVLETIDVISSCYFN